jgi:hypothetical protein
LNLNDVHIRILGVDGAAKSLSYWQSLRIFWIEYFRSCGATLESYTVLRDPTRAAANGTDVNPGVSEEESKVKIDENNVRGDPAAPNQIPASRPLLNASEV